MRAECAAHVFKFFFCAVLLLRASKYKGGVLVRSTSRAKGGGKCGSKYLCTLQQIDLIVGFCLSGEESESVRLSTLDTLIIVLVQLAL